MCQFIHHFHVKDFNKEKGRKPLLLFLSSLLKAVSSLGSLSSNCSSLVLELATGVSKVAGLESENTKKSEFKSFQFLSSFMH